MSAAPSVWLIIVSTLALAGPAVISVLYLLISEPPEPDLKNRPLHVAASRYSMRSAA